MRNISYKALLLFVSFFIGFANSQGSNNDEWAESVATIKLKQSNSAAGASKPDPYSYGYSIEYAVPESIAVNREGKKISGPIQQYALSHKKPKDGQQLKIQYKKDEPVIFKFLEPLQFDN